VKSADQPLLGVVVGDMSVGEGVVVVVGGKVVVAIVSFDEGIAVVVVVVRSMVGMWVGGRGKVVVGISWGGCGGRDVVVVVVVGVGNMLRIGAVAEVDE
jgi:hypothetical protein